MRLSAGQRREAALEAALELVVSEGIESLSVRNISQRAGMSVGSLRHVFPTQDALLADLLRFAQDRTVERIRPKIAALPKEPTAERAIDILMEVLPLTSQSKAEALVQLAVLSLRPGNSEVDEARLRAHEGLDQLTANLPMLGDPLRLRLILDGLMLRILERPEIDEAQARAILQAQCTQHSS
ncbi:TetR/AcrR family transcriptional regulator [Staphylococcus chromogenes]|nr:TetR/AcrR family transcriptional regulator [Staphylococcus chromogenes]